MIPGKGHFLGSGRSGLDTPDSTISPYESAALLDDSRIEGFGTRDYGTAERNSRQDAAIASLPTRLARSASVARRRDRRERRAATWKSFSARSKYYVPVLNWLPEYSFQVFWGDLTAALTLTSMIVPQAMSYSTNLAGLDAIQGLFGAAVPPMIYSVFGTCRQLSVGPEAALSLITGQAISGFISEEIHAHGPMSAGDKAKLGVLISTVLCFEAGLITLGLGILRLGFLDAVLSRALLRGFISAVGLVIFISQLIPVLGLEPELAAAGGAQTTVDKIFFIAENLGNTHLQTFAVSAVALGVLVLAKLFKERLSRNRGFRWLSYVPEVLFVVILSTVLCGVFDWDDSGMEILGAVFTGDAPLRIPFFNTQGYLGKCLGTSTVIAILGFLDSIVGAKDAASHFDYPISPNRELVALGLANTFGSFVAGSLPGYGSITRSRLAGQTGARTQMTSLLTGAFVLLVTYFLLGYLYHLPKCILSVIIMVVVFSILEEAPHDVMFFYRMGAWLDLTMMTLTFVLTFFVNVEVGIVVSVALSIVICIRQSAAMRIKILGRVPNTDFYEPLDDDEDDGLFPQEEIPGILIVRLRDISLTFANAGALKERLRRLERYGRGKHHPSDQPRRAEASVIIFHLADVEDIDASALQIISEVVEAYTARSVLVYWTHVQPQPLTRLAKAGVLDLSGGASHVHPSVQSALNSLNDTIMSIPGV